MSKDPLSRPGQPSCLEAAAFYLHIPYCRSKCHYCSFNSLVLAGQDIAAYIRALGRQAGMMTEHPIARDLVFETLFVGGGTPTIVPASLLADLLTRIKNDFSFTDQVEISIEANPNSLDLADLALLRRAGVNRLSIGVQSFDDDILQIIGRSHTAHEARKAVALARKAGFANISLDLIYGLPGQTPELWRHSLLAALELEVEHLSLYQLMVEEKTPLARMLNQGHLVLPQEDAAVAMDEISSELLAGHGYERYEIANYAKAGYRCRHNMVYWQNRNYIGLGAGAVSCVGGLRFSGIKSPDDFIMDLVDNKQPVSHVEALSREARLRETMIMGLRMIDGLSISEIERRLGLNPAAYYGAELQQLIEKGLLVMDEDQLRLTRQAMPLANQVLCQLV